MFKTLWTSGQMDILVETATHFPIRSPFCKSRGSYFAKRAMEFAVQQFLTPLYLKNYKYLFMSAFLTIFAQTKKQDEQ